MQILLFILLFNVKFFKEYTKHYYLTTNFNYVLKLGHPFFFF